MPDSSIPDSDAPSVGHRTGPATSANTDDTAPAATNSEGLHVRNYDVTRSYELVVELTAPDGTPAFTRRYSLAPGQAESETDPLDPGIYDVSVTLDGVDYGSRECRLGPAPEHTALVEVGNGIVSVSEGLY